MPEEFINIVFSSLKNDKVLFSRLFIASQTRKGDVDKFLRHENQSTPPSLATGGQMRQDDKHSLLDCLEGSVTNSHGTSLDVDRKVLDGPAVVHFLVLGTCGTFDDYAKVFQCLPPHLRGQGIQ